MVGGSKQGKIAHGIHGNARNRESRGNLLGFRDFRVFRGPPHLSNASCNGRGAFEVDSRSMQEMPVAGEDHGRAVFRSPP